VHGSPAIIPATNTYGQATLGREADASFSLRIGCWSGHIAPVTIGAE